MSDLGKQTTSDEAAAKYEGNIKGKTVVVTGGTWGGIGAEAVKTIAKYGASLVIFTGRKEGIIEETIENIEKEVPKAPVKGVIMDLASFESIKKAVSEINSLVDRIDVLINNAGVMACPYSTTKDGFEMQFGVNHLGHFLFTALLKDKLFASSAPRVVNVSSNGTFASPVLFDDINFNKGKEEYRIFVSYGQSKTANILFTRELHDKFNQSNNLSSFVLHPGVIHTNLGRHLGDLSAFTTEKNYWGEPVISPEEIAKIEFKTVSQGAATTVTAAFNDDLPSGSYLSDCQDVTKILRDYATDKANAERLWKVSEDFTHQSFQ
jgi:NAD(P)-dependent dehydrogenase (short-subunit alcohol dehydrogenase family)